MREMKKEKREIVKFTINTFIDRIKLTLLNTLAKLLLIFSSLPTTWAAPFVPLTPS